MREHIQELESQIRDLHLEIREATVYYREQILDLRSENMIMAEHIDSLENQ